MSIFVLLEKCHIFTLMLKVKETGHLFIGEMFTADSLPNAQKNPVSHFLVSLLLYVRNSLSNIHKKTVSIILTQRFCLLKQLMIMQTKLLLTDRK